MCQLLPVYVSNYTGLIVLGKITKVMIAEYCAVDAQSLKNGHHLFPLGDSTHCKQSQHQKQPSV